MDLWVGGYFMMFSRGLSCCVVSMMELVDAFILLVCIQGFEICYMSRDGNGVEYRTE